ncbi:MAG TPA: glycosyltransferase [Phycisphaerae bacterium]|nr:glycosyltransferase [Phycisphaerae bacterium]HRY66805.1 glycosyltransferase [Phycisphaerae bacterium]HSA26863.1 glycosyltransferase [Phycisphaerae bacterium]
MADPPHGSARALPEAALGGTCCVISHKQFYRVDGQYCTTGGFGRYIEVLAQLFDRVIVAVPVRHQIPADGVTPLRVARAQVAELPTYRQRYTFQSLLHPVGYSMPLLAVIRKSDIVHVMFPGYLQVFGFLLARLLRKPVFCSMVGDWEAQFGATRVAERHPRLVRGFVLAHRPLLRWILSSDLVFAYGRKLAESYQRPGRNVVLGEDSTFREEDVRPEETLGPSPASPRLLFVGRLDYLKGIAVLLRALALLRGEGLTPVLTLVGEGPNRGEFEVLVRELGLADAVSFRGYVPMGEQLWRVYREHDLFVLPSFTEGVPKVVIEASANGLPIVATRVGGIPDLVPPETGILVPPKEVEPLTDAIRRILTDDVFRQGLARCGLRWARGKTMEAQARYLEGHLGRSFPDLIRALTSRRAARVESAVESRRG